MVDRADCPQQPWCTCSYVGEQPCPFTLAWLNGEPPE